MMKSFEDTQVNLVMKTHLLPPPQIKKNKKNENSFTEGHWKLMDIYSIYKYTGHHVII